MKEGRKAEYTQKKKKKKKSGQRAAENTTNWNPKIQALTETGTRTIGVFV